MILSLGFLVYLMILRWRPQGADLTHECYSAALHACEVVGLGERALELLNTMEQRVIRSWAPVDAKSLYAAPSHLVCFISGS
jgi:hypothetical protein